jgi:hypothetical protein
MANDYLQTEDGFTILLEDGTGSLLLETSTGVGPPVTPTVSHVGGGGEMPWRGKRTKRRRNRTEELFDEMERTIKATLAEDTLAPVVEATRPAEPRVAERVQETVAELAALVKDQTDYQRRFAQLVDDLESAKLMAKLAYERAREDDDEDAIMMLM